LKYLFSLAFGTHYIRFYLWSVAVVGEWPWKEGSNAGHVDLRRRPLHGAAPLRLDVETPTGVSTVTVEE
jgi:hypothetical protein